jgi:hypothetical protein
MHCWLQTWRSDTRICFCSCRLSWLLSNRTSSRAGSGESECCFVHVTARLLGYLTLIAMRAILYWKPTGTNQRGPDGYKNFATPARAANPPTVPRSTQRTSWFKYDRDKLWLVYTQSVPVIFEPPCTFPDTFLGKLSLLVYSTEQSFLRSWQVLSYAPPEGSLPHSQHPDTCPYPKPHGSSPCTPNPLLEDPF